MTVLSPPQVIAALRKAGFKGQDLCDALALAKGATDLADHYQIVLRDGQPPKWAGMWAMSATEANVRNIRTLFNVEAAALALRGAWVEGGKSFAWHPIWSRNVAQPHIPWAAQQTGYRPRRH